MSLPDELPTILPDPLSHRPTWRTDPTAFALRCETCGHVFEAQGYGPAVCPQCGERWITLVYTETP